jgi:hypothetical protein
VAVVLIGLTGHAGQPPAPQFANPASVARHDAAFRRHRYGGGMPRRIAQQAFEVAQVAKVFVGHGALDWRAIDAP